MLFNFQQSAPLIKIKQQCQLQLLERKPKNSFNLKQAWLRDLIRDFISEKTNGKYFQNILTAIKPGNWLI